MAGTHLPLTATPSECRRGAAPLLPPLRGLRPLVEVREFALRAGAPSVCAEEWELGALIPSAGPVGLTPALRLLCRPVVPRPPSGSVPPVSDLRRGWRARQPSTCLAIRTSSPGSAERLAILDLCFSVDVLESGRHVSCRTLPGFGLTLH